MADTINKSEQPAPMKRMSKSEIMGAISGLLDELEAIDNNTHALSKTKEQGKLRQLKPSIEAQIVDLLDQLDT